MTKLVLDNTGHIFTNTSQEARNAHVIIVGDLTIDRQVTPLQDVRQPCLLGVNWVDWCCVNSEVLSTIAVTSRVS